MLPQNFTKDLLLKLPLPETGKRDVYYDSKTNGLQLRVTSYGVKTFSYVKRIGGRLERITLGKFPDMSIEQARKKTTGLAGQIAMGSHPGEEKRAFRAENTLAELYGGFISHRRNKRGAYLAEKTIRTYRYDYSKHLEKWGKRKLSQIRATDIKKLHSEIGRQHPTTANHVLAFLSSMYSYAEVDNPCSGIKKFPENKRDRFIQADELPAFFAALANETSDKVRDYVLISLFTGARQSNVLAMRWEHISLTRREWRIPTTKNGEPQLVTLTDEALEVLRNRQHCHPVWVFPSQTSASGHLEEPKKVWQRIKERAGITDIRLHDLRRTLGSWQAKTGASLVIIGKSLNHKTPNTTAIYARLDQDPVRESIERATEAMLRAANSNAKG